MRVLYVINGLGTGGAERSLFETAPRLVERGVEVQVVILFVRVEGVEADARGAGIDVTVLRSSSWGGRARELRQLVRSRRPDVVHSTIFEADMLARITSPGQGVPLLTSLVNTSYDKIRRTDPNAVAWKLELARIADAVSGRLLTDHFHAISHTVASAAVRHLRIPPHRITVVPRGRDESRLGRATTARRRAARASLHVRSEVPLVVSVGRQEFQKGHLHLLDAAAEVIDSRPDVQFVIAGREGNATRDLQQRLDRLRLSGSVRFLGHRDDVGDLLAAADVFAFPSLYEGLGGALLEAMAMEVPAVVSNVPALREVTDDGRAGVLVPRGHSRELARGILGLLDDRDRRDALALRGRRVFEHRHRLDAVVDQMADLYAKVGTLRS